MARLQEESSMRSLITSTMHEDFKALGLSESTERNTDSVPLEERGMRTIRTYGTSSSKRAKVQKGTASERRKWKMAKKGGHAKALSRKRRKSAKFKRRQKRIAGIRARLHQGNDVVANMLENTQNILASIDEDKIKSSISGFAQVAIMAEMLARTFSYIAEDTDDEELTEAAVHFANMAEEAGALAKAIQEGVDLDQGRLAEGFSEAMTDLLEGLSLFEDLTGDDEDSEDDEDDEVVAESDDEDCDDDEDEDDDDDEDEEDDDEDEDVEESARVPFSLKKKKK
jgi:hypothetical protein